MKLSCVVITLNEEANLDRCLASLGDVIDEIVIVDSGSTDGTRRIAADFGARWFHQDWLGYVGQRNLALSHATCEWVLVLDADEELSPQLREEIRETLNGPIPQEVAGFSMPRCVLYEGRWIRHGDWYPDRLARLFQRRAARYVGAKVHERLEVEGVVAPLSHDIHHYSFRDEADHVERCRRYARLWAESRWEAGRRCGPFAPWTHCAFRWLRSYLFRGGFLDGRQGWKIAWIAALEVWLKYTILREMARQTDAPA